MSSSPPPLSPLSPARPPLQARRREALFEYEDIPPPKSPQRNIPFPPLSIDIPPSRRPKNSERPPVQQVELETGRDDDIDEEMETPRLMSEGHGKTVTFLDDEDLTDQSSICQSPSWEGYGEKRKKKKEEAEQKRKEKERAAKEAKAAKKKLATRLSKEPPTSESRPPISARAASAPLLDSQHPLLRAQGRMATIPINRNPNDFHQEMASLPSPKSPSFKVHSNNKDNGFIGGVRLERERDVALRVSSDVNTSSSRSSTSSRPLPEHIQQKRNLHSFSPDSNAQSQTPQMKKQKEHTPPPVSYPPTSSKSFAIKGKSHHSRSRSGSLLSEAAKLLNPRGQDFKANKLPTDYSTSNGSQESIQTLPSAQDERGRPVNANGYVDHVRSQSTERHINGLLDELRLAQLPGIARTRSSSQQTRSTSSNNTSSIPRASPDHPPALPNTKGQEYADINEHPTVPTPDEPLLQTKSVSSGEVRFGSNPNPKNAPQASKKSFKDAAKAALKASINPIPPYLRRAQTAPTVTPGVVLNVEAFSEEEPLETPKPERVIGEHNASEVTVRPTPPPQPESTSTTETRGSASSSSSYNDSSIPPSPVTTPDTSRPQSRRGVQEPALGEVPKGVAGGLLIDDDERTLRVPYEAVTIADQSSSNYSSRANSRPGSRDQPASQSRPGSKGSSGLSQAIKESRGHVEEDHLASDILQDNWARTALPLDLDAQSFMGSFTNIELSTPEVDTHISPMSAGKEVKQIDIPEEEEEEEGLANKFDMEIPQRHPSLTKSFSDQDISDRIDTSFLPPLKHQALPPKAKARANHFGLSPIENDPRPKPQVRTISFDSSIPLSNTAAAYLQEARHAVSTSPRPPLITTTPPMPSAPPRSQTQPLRPALKSVTSSTSQPETLGPKPIAKMFVECCGCKFYHDMPSRVYECMARPNEMVEDRKLGVSGAITTCVKCPWCSHNMSTSCCAGYAAVVYLREKLHGP